MKLKYDLVIIGGTKQGLLAAEYGTKLGARVALVINNNCLTQNDNQFFSLEFKDDLLNLDNCINFKDFLAEKKILFTQKYLPDLELLGVDIIISSCEFNCQKRLTLATEKDELESVSYLLAMTSNQLFSEDILSNNNNILSINDLISRNNWDNLPENLVIVGNYISTIYLANKLAYLGKKITLITENRQLLPTEDDDISFQMQLTLESREVKIYNKSNINDFDNFKINNLIENDANFTNSQVVIIDNHKICNEDKLGLKRVGIQAKKAKIFVNSKLQTKHSQIYGCGDLLGGYSLDNITEYETKIAVNNCLFFPWQQVNYNNIPYTLVTNPPINRIGYTQKQAELLSGKKAKVLTLHSYVRSSLNFTQNTIFIKIILDKNNYILGFHSLGFGVEEILAGITLLMEQQKPLKYLFKLKFSQLNSLQIIKDIQQAWLEKNKKQNQIIIDLATTFFIWKRE